MNIKSVCNNYFHGFSIIQDSNASFKKKVLASCSIASYFLVLPPLIFGIGYIFSNFKKDQSLKITPQLPTNTTNLKVQETFQEKIIPPLSKKEDTKPLKHYPDTKKAFTKGFFVEVLNENGYSINGKNIKVPSAGKPQKFSIENRTFKECLDTLKNVNKIENHSKLNLIFKDLSTEQAIAESSAFTIALNFANEQVAGGGPGFHKDKNTKLFVYDAPSARAQEESLCQRSNLLASLTQLPHTAKADKGTHFIRSHYDEVFDSRTMAYASSNHLFATQNPQNFYFSNYLEKPKAVVFITSAAKYHYDTNNSDYSKNTAIYKDAKQRIETHLLAAAASAGAFKKDNPDQPVELILGAFGCGAFAPRLNPDDYRKMIATIYKELLPEFHGFFDRVTFAVPTFGSFDKKNSAVANHDIFKSVLEL